MGVDRGDELTQKLVNLLIGLRGLRREGGVSGVFCMLGSYESALPYGTSVFYRLLKFNRELEI